MNKFLVLVLTCLAMTGCDGYRAATSPLPPLGPNPGDEWLIVDRAVLEVSKLPDGTITARMIPQKIFDWLIPSAVAYGGGVAPAATLTTITYNNPASTVGFTLSQATTAGTYTGEILSFGTFAITGLNDNTLKKCTVAGVDATAGGNNKCTRAAIRVYSATGDLNGSTGVFCNTADNYCVPLLVDTLPVGVAVANAAYVQNLTIANNKNRLRAVDFTSVDPSYAVSMDMTNAGSGTYTSTLIVEYVLRIP